MWSKILLCGEGEGDEVGGVGEPFEGEGEGGAPGGGAIYRCGEDGGGGGGGVDGDAGDEEAGEGGGFEDGFFGCPELEQVVEVAALFAGREKFMSYAAESLLWFFDVDADGEVDRQSHSGQFAAVAY